VAPKGRTYQYRLKAWTKEASLSARTWPGMGEPYRLKGEREERGLRGQDGEMDGKGGEGGDRGSVRVRAPLHPLSLSLSLSLSPLSLSLSLSPPPMSHFL
jgi:hypothetical protein